MINRLVELNKRKQSYITFWFNHHFLIGYNKKPTEEGVLGIHFIPSDGFLWAESIQQKLNNYGYNLKSVLLDLTSTRNSHLYETNVLLVSPDFSHIKNLNFLHEVDQRKTLVVLLGTNALEIHTFWQEQTCHKLLHTTHFEMQPHEDCVNCLVLRIINMHTHCIGLSDQETEVHYTLPLPMLPEIDQASCAPHKRIVAALDDRNVSFISIIHYVVVYICISNYITSKVQLKKLTYVFCLINLVRIWMISIVLSFVSRTETLTFFVVERREMKYELNYQLNTEK